MTLDDIDKSELIFESFRIDGIQASECRSIFLDWAIKLPMDIDQRRAIQFLIATYAAAAPDHPMRVVLRAALVPTTKSGRRGGHAARVGR